MVNAKYDDSYTKLFIFLSPTGMEASEVKSWVALGYGVVANILDQIDHGQISEKVSYIIDDYKEIVGRYIVQNDELEQIARKIYKRHKEAFDLIYDKVFTNKNTTILLRRRSS